MATSDAELISEVRSLTNYDSELISDSDFNDLVAIAKEEILLDVDAGSVSYYGSNTHANDRALFWLTALFAKVKAGEVGASTFSVADVRANSDSWQTSMWLSQYDKAISQNTDSLGFGSTTVARDDREYSYE